jgi:hypothetical protein
LLDSSPVKNWNNEIQQGVYNMTILVIELIATRLHKPGVNESLLNTLKLIFTSDNVFHKVNHNKIWDKPYFSEKLSTFFTKDIDSNGYLLNFINCFGVHNGFQGIKAQLDRSNDINEFNLLLKPLSMCCNLFNRDVFAALFGDQLRRLYHFIKDLEGEDFKNKNVGKVFELLATMKKLSSVLWVDDLKNFNALHLSVALNMLKNTHFNSKMNSLKEICKLIDIVTNSTVISKTTIKEDKLIEWIISERIISLAVEGNIDQVQYCEKIKTIIEFIGDRIKNEEIKALWSMQFNKSSIIVDNLYTIIGIAATKFNPEQLDFLILQIMETWNNQEFKLHDKLVVLLRTIGRDAKNYKTCTRILDALWELRNRQGLNRQLLLLIYNEHLSVLNGGRMSRDMAKREYLKKCCEDIKKSPGSSISIAALRHLHEILNSYQRSKGLKEVLSEVVVPIMKNLCTSLLKCHSNAYELARQSKMKFDKHALIDNIFSHEEVVQTHLNAIKFILQEGNLYLNLNRAQEIWETLISNTNSCDWDEFIGFEWFIDCIADLNEDSRVEIFKNQVLHLDTKTMSQRGYDCFKLYFIRVNEHEGKIQFRINNNNLTDSVTDNFIVAKLDLIGIDFLWDIILYSNSTVIADKAAQLLLEVLYEKVNLKLKRETIQLHDRFIKDCYSRLNNMLIALDNSSCVNKLLFNSFRIAYYSTTQLTNNINENNSINSPVSIPVAPKSQILKCIERLLMIAERYIIAVEETSPLSGRGGNNSSSNSHRVNLPHFLTFKSETFLLQCQVTSMNNNETISTNQLQNFELFACNNETLGELRGRIASTLQSQAQNIQIIFSNDQKPLNFSNDNKLLDDIGIDGMEPLTIKVTSTYPAVSNNNNNISILTTPNKDSNFGFVRSTELTEQEKSLPSYLISNDTHAFEMFHRIEDLEESKIKLRIRNILKLIPTDPKLIEAYERLICTTSHTQQSLSSATGAASSFTNPSPLSDANCAKSASSMDTDSSSSASTTTLNPFQNSDVKELWQFFDSNTLPLHRILYHLEALSSRLMPPMPTEQPTSYQLSANLFQQNFLRTNGLEILISLLRVECNKMGGDDEYKTKQDILILLLQLMRLILFGTYYPQSPTLQNHVCTNKRPSSEPIESSTMAKKTITTSMVTAELLSPMTCGPTQQPRQTPSSSPLLTHSIADFSKSSTISNQIESNTMCSTLAGSSLIMNDCSSLQKMSLHEIIEIIVQLLKIFWAAAAGNLNLNYNHSAPIKILQPIYTNNSHNSCESLHSSSPNRNKTIQKLNNETTTATAATINEYNDMKEDKEEDQLNQVVQFDLETNTPRPMETTTATVNSEQIDDNMTNKYSGIAPGCSKEVKFLLISEHRLSTGSNISNSSMDSSDTQSQCSLSQQSISNTGSSHSIGGQLHRGYCVKQDTTNHKLTIKDIKIAAKAIEMVTCFIQYRKDCLPTLFNMKMFSECIIDVLTGSVSSEVRVYMEMFLLKLFRMMDYNFRCKDFLLNLILKAHIPLWSVSSMVRSSAQILISKSCQYFRLRSALLQNMTLDEQSAYQVDIQNMLSSECTWFLNFTTTRCLKHLDDILLIGHLCLTKSLLTCEGANKTDCGDEIITQLIRLYLFPASYIINYPSDDTSMEPICSTQQSRLAAYKLLAELSRNNIKNTSNINKMLIQFHHREQNLANEWNYIPLVETRADCDYVGLKNGGATCYMNAVLQQLYMIPELTNYILSIDDEMDKQSVFWQLQNVMAHLKSSKLQYYNPESFWKAFRMMGQEVNIREQQDAFDFFTSITDQIDEHLLKSQKKTIFKDIFGGTFANQFICKDCNHR